MIERAQSRTRRKRRSNDAMARALRVTMEAAPTPPSLSPQGRPRRGRGGLRCSMRPATGLEGERGGVERYLGRVSAPMAIGDRGGGLHGYLDAGRPLPGSPSGPVVMRLDIGETQVRGQRLSARDASRYRPSRRVPVWVSVRLSCPLQRAAGGISRLLAYKGPAALSTSERRRCCSCSTCRAATWPTYGQRWSTCRRLGRRSGTCSGVRWRRRWCRSSRCTSYHPVGG